MLQYHDGVGFGLGMPDSVWAAVTIWRMENLEVWLGSPHLGRDDDGRPRQRRARRRFCCCHASLNHLCGRCGSCQSHASYTHWFPVIAILFLFYSQHDANIIWECVRRLIFPSGCSKQQLVNVIIRYRLYSNSNTDNKGTIYIYLLFYYTLNWLTCGLRQSGLYFFKVPENFSGCPFNKEWLCPQLHRWIPTLKPGQKGS